MSEAPKKQKETGAYYTPRRLADYIVYRLFSEGGYSFNKKHIDVLEPSVGGGMFLSSLLNGNHYMNKKKFSMPYLNINAVEINPEVARSTGKAARLYNALNGKVTIHNQDYLKFFLNKSKRYDLIIGNPPYVRRRNMASEQRELCAEVHKATGLKDVNPKNLWTSFLAGAKASLNKKGVIAFVLPTDLLQVKYSEEIRQMLQDDFDRVEIFSFNWLTFKKFDDIEQDVVILICSNGHGYSRGVDFYHINTMEELEEPKVTQDHDNSRRSTLNKWTNYILSEDEFKFLDKIHEKVHPESVRYYCDSGAGIVTAANDYYIVNQKTVEDFSLEKITKPTIKKSSSMFPAVVLTKNDLRKKANEGAELFFLDFPDKQRGELPQNYKDYLKIGEEQDIHKRYKMLLRSNWYAVPSVWTSEAFFTKRSNIYPRIIVNTANAYVTDAFYRIRVKDGIDINNLSFSFYNTFTFIYAELTGRYYGGGVLELTPNEFKELPLPYISKNVSNELKQLDMMVRSGTKLTQILDYADEIILRNEFNITQQDIKKMRKIYIKLMVRRMKKTNIGIGE
jgi:adenine-specific DNA-methyltransferase